MFQKLKALFKKKKVSQVEFGDPHMLYLCTFLNPNTGERRIGFKLIIPGDVLTLAFRVDEAEALIGAMLALIEHMDEESSSHHIN